jgi:hypothetical protein
MKTAVSIVIALVLLGFAVPGALNATQGEKPAAALCIAVCSAIVGLCIWAASSRRHGPWIAATAAALTAAALPLATEATPGRIRSALALAITSAAAYALTTRREAPSEVVPDRPHSAQAHVAAILMGIACALTPTGLLMPLAYAWSARRALLRATGILGLAAVGVACGLLLARYAVAFPIILAAKTLPTALAGYAFGRDLTLLLPLILLGVAGSIVNGSPGVLRGASNGKPDACVGATPSETWERAWASAGVLAVLWTLFIGGLDPRLALLPLAWCSPAGLARLRQALSARAASDVAIAVATVLLLVILTLPLARGWFHAVLITLFAP